MQQPKATYQNYIAVHNDFNEEHKNISRQINVLYQLPKNFMEENEKAIQSFVAEKQPADVPHHSNFSPVGVRDFLFTVEDFKLQTMELFFEHRVHIERCTTYVLRVNEIKSKTGTGMEIEEQYIQLIPEVEELKAELNGLLLKAKMMAERLKAIEERWKMINSKSE